MTAQLVKLPEVATYPKVKAFLDSKARKEENWYKNSAIEQKPRK